MEGLLSTGPTSSSFGGVSTGDGCHRSYADPHPLKRNAVGGGGGL